MKTPPITFERFKSTIGALSDTYKLQREISESLRKFDNSQRTSSDMYFPTMDYTVVDLLTDIFGDVDGWISYWIYDLEFGAKYHDGSVKDANGNNISLKTVEDLWKILLED